MLALRDIHALNRSVIEEFRANNGQVTNPMLSDISLVLLTTTGARTGRGRYRAAMREASCSGCGAMVPDAPGPVHAYMHASPGCWALYCGIEDWKASLAAVHDAPTLIQHLVDSYAVQHAANSDRRNRQSVAVPLMSLIGNVTAPPMRAACEESGHHV